MDPNIENQEYKAYIRLLTANQKRIYVFIYAMVPNHAVSEDIMQETSLFMWERFKQFKDGTNFAAWGMSIARNMVMKYYRKQKRKGFTFDPKGLENLIDQSNVFNQSNEEQIEALRDCFKKLGNRERELLEMRYIQGKSVQIIAENLNRTTSHLYRIMAKTLNILLNCINVQLTS